VFAENYTSDKNPDNSAATSDMQPDYFSGWPSLVNIPQTVLVKMTEYYMVDISRNFISFHME
jgi:hypothetical protein